jgi:hypothetical protein
VIQVDILTPTFNFRREAAVGVIDKCFFVLFDFVLTLCHKLTCNLGVDPFKVARVFRINDKSPSSVAAFLFCTVVKDNF